jgi:hypothetical protein
VTTYFGYDHVGGSSLELQANAWKTNAATYGAYSFACPGSNVQNVDTLEVYTKSGSGAINVGIYLADLTLICKGTATKNAATNSWIAWAAAALTWYHGYTALTGGTTYYLCVGGPYSTYVAYDVGSAGDVMWNNDVFTALPDPFYNDGTTTSRISIRCGVTAAGGTLNQEGFRFRNDDGDEDAASWKEAQDTNLTAPKSVNTRLRTILDATGDPATAQYQLEYRRSGQLWRKVEAE